MQKQRTEQVLSGLKIDLESIGARPPSIKPPALAPAAASPKDAEMRALQARLADVESMSTKSFDIIRKQSSTIRALRADLEEREAQKKELAAHNAELSNAIAHQNAMISRLLCLPPNASDIP